MDEDKFIGQMKKQLPVSKPLGVHISKCLELYTRYIEIICSDRKKVKDELLSIINEFDSAEDEKTFLAW